jgi:hypothetical protein
MGLPTCTVQEFVGVWNKHHSAAAVARELGLHERNVHARRRKIEKDHGIRLLTFDYRAAFDQSMLVTADRAEVKLKIKDGIVIVGNDAHFWPGCIPTMHRAYLHLSAKLKPFAQLWNGDFFDGPSISRFPSIGWEKNPSVLEELRTVQERSAEVIQSSPNSKRIWTAGNHDLRMETRLSAHVPEFANVQGMHLKDHIPGWTPAWFVTINEGTESHTEIRHRQKGGVHASYNNTKETGVTLVTGHDHRADVVPYDDRRGRRYGVRTGMMADSARDPQFISYVEARQCNWQSGIAVLTYKNGLLLQPELALRLDDKHFQFRGEIVKV